MPTTWTPAEKRTLHLGLAYLMTTDGIPSLYYGVEQQFAGGNDPANRETMWSSSFYDGRTYTNGMRPLPGGLLIKVTPPTVG